MKKISRIIFTIAILLQFSCERHDNVYLGSVDCADCYSVKPEYVRLNALITINDENPKVKLTVYVGNCEEGQVDWVDSTYMENYWVDVKPDRYYSMKAEYKDGDKTIYVIDGDEVKLKYTENSCDVGCYYKVGGFVDLRLKD